MSELALELLTQLSQKLNTKTEEEGDKISKCISEIKYTKAQNKQIRKQEMQVAKIMSEVAKFRNVQAIMETYHDILSKPLSFRYVTIGSSVKPHHGYVEFINAMIKLILFHKVKGSDRLRKCVKF